MKTENGPRLVFELSGGGRGQIAAVGTRTKQAEGEEVVKNQAIIIIIRRSGPLIVAIAVPAITMTMMTGTKQLSVFLSTGDVRGTCRFPTEEILPGWWRSVKVNMAQSASHSAWFKN